MNGTAKLKFGDVEVQRIGLGTNRLRKTPANVAFLREAVAAGIDHIDTAHTYTGGESEQTIGAALSPIPEQCMVATKGGWASGRPDALRATPTCRIFPVSWYSLIAARLSSSGVSGSGRCK
jgi:aryl-alcohol dehydrogenase-like predicted oxidoreductase